MDSVSLHDCMENVERKTVSGTTEGQENQPTEQVERPGSADTRRLRDEQKREFGDLAEYTGTQEDVAVDHRGIF